MSYSFNISSTTKSGAVTAAVEELGRVVERQPAHSADFEPACKAIESFVSLIPDRDPSTVEMTVIGSIWNHPEDGVKHVHISIDVRIV